MKDNKKVLKIIGFILLATILLGLIFFVVNYNKAKEQKTVSEIWTTAGSTVSTWFNEDTPDLMGTNVEPSIIRVGKTSEGKDIFSLLHLPLRATFLGNEIENAKLYLKIVDGEAPEELRVQVIKGFWSNSFTELADAKEVIDSESATTIAVKKENDGWISIDITSFVIEWINGNKPNYGLALFGNINGKQTSFVSDWEGNQYPPRLEVTGSIGERNLSYGKFGYIRHPENESDDAIIEENETANCLSYALRDTDLIGSEELGLDYSVMTDIYKKSNEDAVVDYTAEKVLDYVNKNKDKLKISNIRQIESFDSEIDPKKEYRIAFRVKAKLLEDEEMFDDVLGNFDYHVMAQINTGQWAQKFMFTPTEIVPGMGPNVSPEKYPWNSSLEWGIQDFFGTYTSKTIYFAVTKDVDGFTAHKH